MAGIVTQHESRWPHRWAVALACATFPLLWVGGLVTTTKAGMAVPDWPTTFGYNPLLYPMSWWLSGPWDLFVEHGHRLLAGAINLLTVGLLVTLWRKEDRTWLRWLGIVALGLVLFQDYLGGMRVRLDERTLAMLHGITGPVFFALTVAITVFTSRRWRSAANRVSENPGGGAQSVIPKLAVVTCILVYLQMMIGAVIRHAPGIADPNTFAMAVRFHLFLAAMLTLHVIALFWLVKRRANMKPLAGLATTLGILIFIQLLLGIATWMERFALPAWAADLMGHSNVTISDGGWLQTHIITAHVAVGSLLLATSLALALYSLRLLAPTKPEREPAMSRLGAAV